MSFHSLTSLIKKIVIGKQREIPVYMMINREFFMMIPDVKKKKS